MEKRMTKPKKYVKVAPKASVPITGWKHTCQKCGEVWQTFDKPLTCHNRDCRSPSWDKIR
jgi:hypothetical protein